MANIKNFFLQMVTQLKASRIDLIFDQYFTPSIKDYEHSQRFEQVRSSDFIKQLKNLNFKEALVNFFILHWATDEVVPFIGNQIFHIHSFIVNDSNKVVSCVDEALSCPAHEKADTKIMHAALTIKRK